MIACCQWVLNQDQWLGHQQFWCQILNAQHKQQHSLKHGFYTKTQLAEKKRLVNKIADVCTHSCHYLLWSSVNDPKKRFEYSLFATHWLTFILNNSCQESTVELLSSPTAMVIEIYAQIWNKHSVVQSAPIVTLFVGFQLINMQDNECWQRCDRKIVYFREFIFSTLYFFFSVCDSQ